MLHIISDSTCDLSPELIERYQIRILPLNVNLGEETYIDGKTITPEELYAWSDRTRQTPKTAVFSETTAMDLFSECLKDGGEIICFAISESMSASAQVMRMAAAELHADFLRQSVGQTLPVLFETEEDGLWQGHSDTYVLVKARGDQLRGKVLPVKITGTDGDALTGEIV